MIRAGNHAFSLHAETSDEVVRDLEGSLERMREWGAIHNSLIEYRGSPG